MNLEEKLKAESIRVPAIIGNTTIRAIPLADAISIAKQYAKEECELQQEALFRILDDEEYTIKVFSDDKISDAITESIGNSAVIDGRIAGVSACKSSIDATTGFRCIISRDSGTIQDQCTEYGDAAT